MIYQWSYLNGNSGIFLTVFFSMSKLFFANQISNFDHQTKKNTGNWYFFLNFQKLKNEIKNNEWTHKHFLRHTNTLLTIHTCLHLVFYFFVFVLHQNLKKFPLRNVDSVLIIFAKRKEKKNEKIILIINTHLT